MESRMHKIFAEEDRKIALKVYEGHFATPHSHITHYFDMTTLRTRASEASAVARVLARHYELSTIVDTIICMDGTEVIGAYLAEELSNAGIMSMNAHETIYVVAPEININGQLMFQDNMTPMIKNKNVLILTASATTGGSLQTCMDCVKYYEGKLQGACAIFSAIRKVNDMPVISIFSSDQVAEYRSYTTRECPNCRAQKKIDAIVNGFGYSKL
ncbi:MAG: orotate phosphoribosyltransferase [Clostridia bacterium]|nr:orotate phosphoribosyltransferase [Clostridia bacterium]NCC44812.1 orotate phosphoribosyltransferase [Clostridia bacterium]